MSNLHGTSEHVCEFGAGISCVACSKAALSQRVIANCRKLASHVALEQLPDLSYGSLYTGSAAPIALGTGATCQTTYMVEFWSMRALRWWPRTVTCDSYPPVSWRLNCANLAAHNLSQRALSHEQPTWHQRACLRVWRQDKLRSLLKSSFVPTCHSTNCRNSRQMWPWSSCQIFQTVRRTQVPLPPSRSAQAPHAKRPTW